jgi:hypothetical protein
LKQAAIEEASIKQPTTNEPYIGSNLPHSLPYPKRHLPMTPRRVHVWAQARSAMRDNAAAGAAAGNKCEAEWERFQEKISSLQKQTAHPCIGNASSTN